MASVQNSDTAAERLAALAQAYKALGNPVRLRILQILAGREGCFCGDIVEIFGMAQSTISHHLKTLKDAGLIRGSERGTWVCYCLDRDRLRELADRLAPELLAGHALSPECICADC